MEPKKPPLISIITATLNSGPVLTKMLMSLELQTDKDFELVIQDGGSTDKIDDLVLAGKTFPVRFESVKDRGPADAANKAILRSRGEYLIFLGADDRLEKNAIALYKREILNSRPEMVVAKTNLDNRVMSFRRPRWVWLYGSQAKIGASSVGMCIRKSFFLDVGLFPVDIFSIYSDGYFLLKALRLKPRIVYGDFLAGEFSSGGKSNNNIIFSITEHFCAQVIIGRAPIVQLFLLNVRILKWLLLNPRKLCEPRDVD